MTDQLEDWQLALLVEAKRLDDPTVVEATAAETYRDYRDLIDQAETLEMPVAVERDDAQTLEKADALLDAAEGIDEWDVVPADQREDELEACEAIEDLLSDALKEHNGLRDGVVDAMSAPQMVSQFRDEDDGGIALESLAQQPETGGAGDDVDPDDSDDGGLDALSGEDRREARDLLRRADLMENRTPEHAEALRDQAAVLVGVDDADTIDLEVL